MLTTSSLLDCVSKLRNSLQAFRITPQNYRKLEQIDKEWVAQIFSVETKCRKLTMGNVARSPQVQHSIQRIRYMRLCIRHFPWANIISWFLETLFKHCQPCIRPLNLLAALQQLKIENNVYNVLKKDADAIWHDFLMSLAQAKSLNNEGDVTTIFKIML